MDPRVEQSGQKTVPVCRRGARSFLLQFPRQLSGGSGGRRYSRYRDAQMRKPRLEEDEEPAEAPEHSGVRAGCGLRPSKSTSALVSGMRLSDASVSHSIPPGPQQLYADTPTAAPRPRPPPERYLQDSWVRLPLLRKGLSLPSVSGRAAQLCSQASSQESGEHP